MSAHAKFSPSRGKLWSVCADSVNAPDGPTSAAAELGTAAAHHAAEFLLNGTPVPDGFEQLATYTDYVLQVVENMGPCEWIAERKFFHPVLGDLHFGTADFAAWNDRILFVCDLKWGTSVRVTAADNEQLMSYINLAQQTIGPRDVLTGAICHPRMPDKQIDVAQFTPEQIENWDRRTLAQTFRDDRVAGRHCWQGFCRLRSTCGAYQAWKQRK